MQQTSHRHAWWWCPACDAVLRTQGSFAPGVTHFCFTAKQLRLLLPMTSHDGGTCTECRAVVEQLREGIEF